MHEAVDSSAALGALIRRARKAQGLRLEDLALAAGTGIRFLSELERGKPTAQLDPALRVLRALGLRVEIGGAALDADA